MESVVPRGSRADGRIMDEPQKPSAISTEPSPGGSRGESVMRVNPDLWVEEYGDALFCFAAGRVRDRAIAQDLVQETFLAAIKAQDGFAGRSSERSWLFGILRNK
jgi:hypothetical protein